MAIERTAIAGLAAYQVEQLRPYPAPDTVKVPADLTGDERCCCAVIVSRGLILARHDIIAVCAHNDCCLGRRRVR